MATVPNTAPHGPSKTARAAMAALVVAPLAAAASVLIQTTLSEKSADLTDAFTHHRNAMIAGLTVNCLALAVLVAGVVWIAVTLAPRARTLATVGGILGVGGLLLIVFENGLTAAAPSLYAALDPEQAARGWDAIHDSAAMSMLQPVSLLGGVGVALLGIAAGRLGASWWAAGAVVVGAIGQGVGFASASRPVTGIAFLLLFVGWVGVLRTLDLRADATVTAAHAQPRASASPAV